MKLYYLIIFSIPLLIFGSVQSLWTGSSVFNILTPTFCAGFISGMLTYMWMVQKS